METKTYTTIDRTDWPSGPWDGEPDKMQWQDEATGFPCLAVRNRSSGVWCGYVGVSEGHPHFERDYNDVDVRAHGGLTFAGKCQPGSEDHGICHTPAPGEPDHVWWLGFDCNHSGDWSPLSARMAMRPDGAIFARGSWEEYRTLPYVRAECRSIARQLAAQGSARSHQNNGEER